MLEQCGTILRDQDCVIDALATQFWDASTLYCALSRLESNIWNGKLVSCDVDSGHIMEYPLSAGVGALDISNHSNFILAGRDDGILSFHTPDLSEVARVCAHVDIISATSAHSSASQCVSVGWDGRLALWDWSATGNPLIEKVEMQCQYRDAAYNKHANCSVISTVGNDGFLRLWDPRVLNSGCSNMFNLQQMGTCCAWISEHELVVGLENGTVLEYDIRHQCIGETRVSDTTIRRIRTHGDSIAAASEDGAVTMWRRGAVDKLRSVIHPDYITDLLWHSRGIFTSSVDKTVLLSRLSSNNI